MKKKLLAALSMVMVAVIAMTGTMAYLQDDDSDVNVMTLGNVSIKQHEYQRALNEDGTYKTATIDNRTSYVLEEFEQGKALLPSALNTTTWEGWGWSDFAVVRNSQVGSYGGMSVFKDASNAQDKFVYVENTGKTDAYVRTLVAVEVGNSTIDLLNFNVHLGAWAENEIGKIKIDGNYYYVLEYVYTGAQLSDGSWRHENGVLPAGDMTYNSFAQVYIHSRATNEDMEALDGNNNGTLDILVLSQAVQAAGFEKAQTALDTAFGTSAANAAIWFGGMANPTGIPVETVAELTDALEAGDDVFLLNDIELDGDVTTIAEDVTINLNGHNLDASANESRPFTVTNGATLTIDADGSEVDCGAYGLVNMTEGTVTINGGTFTQENGNNGSFIRVSGDEEMEINLNNVTYKAGTTDSGVIRTSGSNVTVNVVGGTYEAGMGFLLENGSITDANITATNTANMWPAVYADGDVTVSGCTIKSACHAIAVGGGNTVTVENCDVQAADGKLAFQVFSSGGTINVNNCTYTGGYGTTGKINAGCPDAVINIDGVEVYRKAAQ